MEPVHLDRGVDVLSQKSQEVRVSPHFVEGQGRVRQQCRACCH